MQYVSCVLFLMIPSFSASAQSGMYDLLQALKSARTDSDRVLRYVDLATAYMYVNPDSAIYYDKEGLELANKIQFTLGQGLLTGDMGYIQESMGRLDEARKYYTEGIAIFKKISYTKGIASLTNAQGVIEGKKGNFASAVHYFIDALKLYESIKDTAGMVSTYQKLGIIDEQSNNLNKALEYYRIASNLAKSSPQAASAIDLYNNIAIVYGKKGIYDTALNYINEGLKHAEGPRFAAIRVNLLMNKGIVYNKLHDNAKAMQYLNSAVNLSRASGAPDDEARLLVNIASVIGDSNPQQGIDYLKEALMITRANGFKELQSEVLGAMVEHYKAMGNYKDALEAQRQSFELQDSILNVENTKAIANLEATYELEKSKSVVKELELENHKKALQRDIIFFVAAAVLVILIIVILYFVKTQRLNKELILQRQELERLNAIKDKIFSIIGHDLRTPMNSILGMLEILELDHSLIEEQDLNDLLLRLKIQSETSIDTLDKLLMWGQAQIKGVRLEQIAFNPYPVIEKNISLLKDAALQKQIILADNVSQTASVYADPTHFDFVIRNLLSNAIKFTHEGGKVEVSSCKSEAAPGFMVFAVKDNGTGMSKEMQAHIFEMHNLSKRGTAQEKGTGIGLMLCKQFVEENGGKLWVESEIGNGSTFYFSMKESHA